MSNCAAPVAKMTPIWFCKLAQALKLVCYRKRSCLASRLLAGVDSSASSCLR